MTPAQLCAELEQQLRECQAKMTLLRDTCVFTHAPAAKSVVYAAHMLDRVVAEIATLNMEERR